MQIIKSYLKTTIYRGFDLFILNKKNDFFFFLQVIQRRDDFDPRENFNRDWSDYKNGFGDPAKEFWLGNENIYMLTNNEEYSLRVELEDFEGNKR